MYTLIQAHRPHDTVAPDELDAVTELMRLAIVAVVVTTDPQAMQFAAAKRDLLARQMVRAYGGLEASRASELQTKRK